MTDKSLKKLSRRDLLKMLLALSRENEQLRSDLEKRTIEIEKSGSLAEAALRLNGLFEATQAACEQYTLNVKLRCEQLEREAREKCGGREAP